MHERRAYADIFDSGMLDEPQPPHGMDRGGPQGMDRGGRGGYNMAFGGEEAPLHDPPTAHAVTDPSRTGPPTAAFIRPGTHTLQP